METQQILENLITKITESEGAWIKPYKNTFPRNYASKTGYNGLNLIQLWFAAEEKDYSTNFWLTYKQVKELGGFVKSGEKATPVFYFKSYETQDEETEELKTIKFLKTFQVFNLDQTSLELENLEDKSLEDIEDFIERTGIEIRSSQTPFYVPSEDYVGMPPKNNFLSLDSYYSTFFHELSHATGHKSRLNREQGGKFGDENYALEELIAETSSVFLQTFFNIETQENNSVSYLKHWLKEQNPKILWKIFSEAQKSFDFLTKK